MSRSPFDRSPDLRRLLDDGYDAVVDRGSLVVRGVPYVAHDGRVLRGQLSVALELAGDATVRPTRHQSVFVGSRPHRADGTILDMFNGLYADQSKPGVRPWHLCLKPGDREFYNFHEFVTMHVRILEAEAQAVSSSASARASTRKSETAWAGPFEYADTATARYRISEYTSGLTGSRIGIVGLGGTGSYVLDLVAKTPVATIHLFDDDVFEQHNAFRAPGAPDVAEFDEETSKVHRFAEIYSRMHSGVIPHRLRIGPKNVRLLAELDFVFLCLDDPASKRPILSELQRCGVPFVDCGIGLVETDDGLAGVVRVTTSVDGRSESLVSDGLIPSSDGDAQDPYSFRAQVADLNALNASLAVIRWKRISGFYADRGGERHSIYVIDANQSVNLEHFG